MSGFQELLLILLIVLGMIFMPRILPKPRVRRMPSSGPRGFVSGRMRLGVAVSVIYLAAAAIWLAPWRQDPVLFLVAGAGPVLAGWLVYWVMAGFRRR